MLVLKNQLIHEDTDEFTIHASVVFPEDSVPVYLDANEECMLGTVTLTREGQYIFGDLTLSEEFPGLPRPFRYMIGTEGSDMFQSEEDDVIYLVLGEVRGIGIQSKLLLEEIQ